MKKNDHGRLSGSFFMNTDPQKDTIRRRGVLCAALLSAALFLALGFGTVRVRAGTQQNAQKTTVIRTESEEAFAEEVSRLARKNPGLSVQSTGKLRPYSSARLIVRIRDGKNIDFSKYSAMTVVQSDFGVSIVQFASANAAKKAAASLNALSSVVYAEPDDCGLDTGDTEILETEIGQGMPAENGNKSSRTGSSTVGNLPSEEDLTYFTTLKVSSLSTASAAMSWGVSYIQADKYAAFVKSNTKRSIKVAVVDTGVSKHTKLKGRLLAGKDFVDNDNDPSDKNGHGTHVAGTIVDCTPGINVFILPVRVMNASGMGNPSVAGNGIRYAVRKGAKVINLSLGGDSHYKYLEECIEYAYKKGVSVIVAAGNFCEDTRYTCPAHLSSPIVVGSINKKGSRSWFSNFGSSVDVVAPGENIRSCSKDGGYMTASGTSMAVPHVSAAAAMYRLMNPSLNVSKIHKLIKSYTKDLGAKGTDRYYGRGVPRMSAGIAPSKVSLSSTKASLEVKGTLTLTAKLFPAYAGKKALSWSSSNSSVVAVSKTGKLTAKKKGKATITVKTVNGKKAVCKVTVTPATISMLSSKLISQITTSSGLSYAGTSTLPKSTSTGTQTLSTKASSAGVQAASIKTVPAEVQSISAAASSTGVKAEAAATAAPTGAEGIAGQPESAAAFQELREPAESVKHTGLEVTASEVNISEMTTAEMTAPEVTAPDVKVPEMTAAETTVSEVTATDMTGGLMAAAEKEGTPARNPKIYVFPSDRPDNAHLRDGTIVTGERLALDYEIVPSRKNESGSDPELIWKSSNPAAASVNENGIVTALSPGETELTLMPAADNAQAADRMTADDMALSYDAQKAGDSSSAETAEASMTCKPLHIHVVEPSILTRDVSYSAAEDETEIQMHAVLRLPGGLAAGSTEAAGASEGEESSDKASAGARSLNPAVGYVLAMFRENEDQQPVLLGAADLNTGADVPVHIHDPETGRQIKESAGMPEETAALTSSAAGKQLDQTGILRIRKIMEESGKADVSLLLDAGSARASLQGSSDQTKAEKEDGQNRRKTEWKCRLAVFESQDFEALETAIAEGDASFIREIDSIAFCSCDFSLKMELTDPSGPAADSSIDSGSETAAGPSSASPEKDHSRDSRSDDQASGDGKSEDATSGNGKSEDGGSVDRTTVDGTIEDRTSEDGKSADSGSVDQTTEDVKSGENNSEEQRSGEDPENTSKEKTSDKESSGKEMTEEKTEDEKAAGKQESVKENLPAAETDSAAQTGKTHDSAENAGKNESSEDDGTDEPSENAGTNESADAQRDHSAENHSSKEKAGQTGAETGDSAEAGRTEEEKSSVSEGETTASDSLADSAEEEAGENPPAGSMTEDLQEDIR